MESGILSLLKIDWARFEELVTEVAEKVRLEYDVDVVVGVGKSGLIPAAIVARKLGVAEFCSVAVRFYDNGKPPKRVLERPRVMHQSFGDLSGKRVLVVDDFSRSGLTLIKVETLLLGKGAEEVRTAVVVLRGDAIKEPDYYGMRFEGCVIFPWDM
jgi:hypoxanthine phosphoribosyltransferase